nr:MMPL family transporter [Actinomyces radicidentis]
MREGTDVMEDELGVDDPVSTIRIMVDGLDDDSERSTVHDGLADLPGVASVSEASDSEEDAAPSVSGGHTLYVISVDGDYDSEAYAQAEEAVASLADGDAAADRAPALEGHVVQWVSDNTSTSSELPVWIVAIALALLVPVLLVMSSSWIEPVRYLVAIGMAVALNMGLVALRPSVSETTYSIAAILQLVLSMDYSIILANRYRQERDAQRDAGEDGRSAPVTAMRRALRDSFGAVVSASLTTVVGLLMLVFMSFRIGADLGTVLGQGVVVSLVTVLTVLPGLLLAGDRLITRTGKPHLSPSLGGLARAEYRFRWVIAAGFVVLLAGSFVLQGGTTTSYTLEREDPVAEVFAKDNQVVLVYDNDDEAAATALGEALAADYPGSDGVRSVTSHGTTIGQQLTKEAAAALEQQGTADDAGAADVAGDDSQSVLPDGAIDVLWYVGNGGEAGTMTLSELGDVAASLELLYLQHAAATRTGPSWTMSTEELLDAAREQVEEAKEELVGAEHSRMIVTTGLREEAEGGDALLHRRPPGACRRRAVRAALARRPVGHGRRDARRLPRREPAHHAAHRRRHLPHHGAHLPQRRRARPARAPRPVRRLCHGLRLGDHRRGHVLPGDARRPVHPHGRHHRLRDRAHHLLPPAPAHRAGRPRPGRRLRGLHPHDPHERPHHDPRDRRARLPLREPDRRPDLPDDRDRRDRRRPPHPPGPPGAAHRHGPLDRARTGPLRGARRRRARGGLRWTSRWARVIEWCGHAPSYFAPLDEEVVDVELVLPLPNPRPRRS